jgi:hypothetical protein
LHRFVSSHACSLLLTLLLTLFRFNQKLWEIFPENDVLYGALYNRHMIGNILFIVTRAVELGTGHNVPALEGSFPDSPFAAWSTDDWEMLSQYLKAAAANLKRTDGTADVNDSENAMPDPERSRAPTLNAKVDKILRYMKVYKITAPIRAQLMVQLEDTTKKDDEIPTLPQDKLSSVWSVFASEIPCLGFLRPITPNTMLGFHIFHSQVILYGGRGLNRQGSVRTQDFRKGRKRQGSS